MNFEKMLELVIVAPSKTKDVCLIFRFRLDKKKQTYDFIRKNSLLISLFLFSVLAHCLRKTAFSFSSFPVEIFISEASLPPSLTANAQLLNGLSVDLSFSLSLSLFLSLSLSLTHTHTHTHTPFTLLPPLSLLLHFFSIDHSTKDNVKIQ